jgi:NAD(P)-dependent dehydrogenase (short-subunit alcohol dehydrogenase family)
MATVGATVLVTGASSGIGKATATKLIEEGHRVYAGARRVTAMQDLAERGATPLAMDVTSEDDLRSVVERITEDTGGIDALVNNAGFGLYGAMEDTDLADARHQFEVNLFGAARLTQLALPHMREQRRGTIVTMSSMGGRIYTPLGSWYHASKHAIEGWSDCLRIELAQFGIRVVVVEPGVMKTEFGDLLVEPMLRRSGRSAYGALAQRVARTTRASYESGGSPPELVADVVAAALRARRPRTRYVVGHRARSTIATRRYLGDRVFDRVVMRAFR